MNKNCSLCGNNFEDVTKSHNKLYCSSKCKTKAYRTNNLDQVREIERKYNLSEKGKIRSNQFSKTSKGKLIRKRYYGSEKGKALIKRFQSSKKWKDYLKAYGASEKYKLQKRRYRQSEIGKLYFKRYSILYKHKHPEKIKRYQENYRKTEKYQEKERRFRKSEIGKAISRKKCRSRRARKHEVNEKFTRLMEKAVFEAFENKCFLTGMNNEDHLIKYKKRLTLDHINPLSLKNPLTFDNVCVLSLSTNGKKSNKSNWNFYTPEQIIGIKRIQEKAKQIYETKYKHLEKHITKALKTPKHSFQ